MGVVVSKFSNHSVTEGKYETFVVTISPVKLNNLWGRRLCLQNSNEFAYEKPP